MERLNYHHLLYFYTVAQEGSVARASLRLGLKQPTVSAQIHALEAQLGRKLLERSGRGLKVTPTGKIVLRYAENIFDLGGELLSTLAGEAEEAPKLAIGVSSSLSPVLVTPLLKALFALKPLPVLTIEEGTTETLSARLASRSLLFALDDLPPENAQQGNGLAAGLHSRVLLESVVEVFAPEAQARRLRKDFPSRLPGAPILIPSGMALRREVESWLAARKLAVKKLAEMSHPEMFAAAASAAIFAPSLLRESLKKSHALLPVGKLEGSRWRLYVLTATKGVRHPGIDAVSRAAKDLR